MNEKIQPIKKQWLFKEVAQYLEKRILKNVHKPGDKLPPEQVLAKEFGVSRNVIREAYKSLMERGLLIVKQGKGTFVTTPNLSVVSQALNRFIQTTKETSYADLYEIRRILEVASARLAAKRATSKDLIAVKNAFNIMEKGASSGEEWAKADLEFHTAIARATHNALFSALLQPITDQLLEVYILGYQFAGAVESSRKYHRKILEKIQAKDIEEAGKAMLDHLKESEVWVKKAMQSY